MMANYGDIMFAAIIDDMLNLRVSRNNHEISTTINTMYADSSPVMIWQNQNGKRVVTYATIEKIDFKNNRILLQSKEKNRFERFSKDYTIYIRGEERSILFKQQDCKLNANKIAVSIPSEVRLFEQRLIPRFETPEKVSVDAHFDKRIGAGVGSERNFSARVMNISKDGMCLEFIQNLGKYFYEDDMLFLSNIDQTSFNPKLEAKIVYINKPAAGTDRMRMGLRFIKPLTQDQLRMLVKSYFLR